MGRFLLIVLILGATAPAAAQTAAGTAQGTAAACNPRNMPGVVWWGTERHLTMERLVSYAAPIFWFSPDEPSLNGATGPAIRHPEAFTFEGAADHPVVYYQLTDLLVRGAEDAASAFERNEADQ